MIVNICNGSSSLVKFNLYWTESCRRLPSIFRENLRRQTCAGELGIVMDCVLFIIRKSHWSRQTTENGKFWITCKRLALLNSFSSLQVIQNMRPWFMVAAYVTVGFWVDYCLKLCYKISIKNKSWYLFLISHIVS